MAHGDFLFPDFCHELSINLDAAGNVRNWGALMEGPAHVVKEAGGDQHDGGWFQVVPAVQEKLGMAVALSGRLGEPVVGLLPAVLVQIQLTEGVLCVLVPSFSGLGEVERRLGDILFYNLTLEIFLAQPVGGVTIFILCGTLQPLDTQLRVMDFWIMGEQQLSQFVLRCWVALPCGLLEPVEGFRTVRDQHRAVLIDLADEILSMEFAVFRFRKELRCRIVPF